jgi:hypothetical protein
MPRRSRIDAAGALHHVMAGGIERVALIRSDTDRKHFLERLGEILQDTKATCYAWMLGVPMSSLARKLRISIASVSESVSRGRRIAETRGCLLWKPKNLTAPSFPQRPLFHVGHCEGYERGSSC